MEKYCSDVRNFFHVLFFALVQKIDSANNKKTQDDLRKALVTFHRMENTILKQPSMCFWKDMAYATTLQTDFVIDSNLYKNLLIVSFLKSPVVDTESQKLDAMQKLFISNCFDFVDTNTMRIKGFDLYNRSKQTEKIR